MTSFSEVFHHRTKYFLSPQLDMYKNIGARFESASDVLDYGCGNGVGALQLVKPIRLVLGIDSDPGVVELASSLFGHLSGLGFDAGDWCVAARPISRLFDLVVCVEVIEHVADASLLLHRLREFTRDDGAAVISTLNHNSQHRKNPAHVGRWAVAEFRELVRREFPGARVYDYTLDEELSDDSTRTPMVAVWRGKEP